MVLQLSTSARYVPAMSQVEESALSATNVPAGCIRSVLVLKTQHSTERRKTGLAALAIPLQHPSQPQAPPPPTPTTTINDAYFTILQWNANGIGNKIDELGIFMEKHKVKLAVIQESKLSQTSSAPCTGQNYTTVRKDRRLGQAGGLLTFVHKSINYLRKPELPVTLGDPHLEELSISAKLGNTALIISNIYIPQPALAQDDINLH